MATAMKQAFLLRFGATLLHLFSTVILYVQMYHNILSTIAPLNNPSITSNAELYAEYFKEEYIFGWLLSISGLLNFSEMIAATCGYPLATGPNLAGTAMHTIGTVLTLWMVAAAWPSSVYLSIFIPCSAVPAVVANFYMVQLFLFKSDYLKRIDIRI